MEVMVPVWDMWKERMWTVCLWVHVWNEAMQGMPCFGSLLY